MRLTVRIKLEPTAAEHSALLETLELCNRLADKVSSIAYRTKVKNKIALHHRTYGLLKAEGLAAQAAVRVIGKVAEAYATQNGSITKGVLKGKSKEKALSKPIQFKPRAGQAFDKNNLSYNLEEKTVSIWTVVGRLKTIKIGCSAQQLELLKTSRKGESDLLYDKSTNTFYLSAGVEIPEEPLQEVTDYLAFDSGIVNIATTSDGDNWSGGAVTANRKKNRRLRKKLQEVGTKSAKRLLKKRSKKESRFVRDVNHCISKKIVEVAKHTSRGIAHENLKGIRERARSNKATRTEPNSWAFHQLFTLIAYKAKLAGVPVKIVNPAYSSQLCPECGTIGRENRSTRDLFCCASCGCSDPADVIAAQNIRTFALAL